MRLFASERVQRADVGPPSEVVVIRCGGVIPIAGKAVRETRCDKRLEIGSKTKEELPPEFVHRQASIKGWSVDKTNPARDLCPDCLYRRKAAFKATKEPEPMNKQSLMTTGAPIIPMDVAHPREMSKDERRIIFAKIDEVYSDGYAAGWTDKRIAEDLNVPRAWVETIRADFFGEAKDNEQIRQFVADLDDAKAGLEAFATERQSMLKRMEDLAVKVSRLLKIGEEIRKSTTP